MKTLVTIGEAELRLVTLVDLTVVQGEPSALEVTIPAGYEVTGVSGASLERHEERPGLVVLFVTNPSQRRHQFLVSLERSNSGGSFKLETGVPALPSAQRETGEIAVEGIGTLEISVPEIPDCVEWMCAKLIGPSPRRRDRRSSWRFDISAGQVACRRWRSASPASPMPPSWPPGRSRDRNHARDQRGADAHRGLTLGAKPREPFVKVTLPPGASMLSVEVAASQPSRSRAKMARAYRCCGPASGRTGHTRCRLYLHAGSPFEKKGDIQMTLPKMDLPISVVEWELFVPDRYRADRFAGNTIDANLVGPIDEESGAGKGKGEELEAGAGSGRGAVAGGRRDAPAGFRAHSLERPDRRASRRCEWAPLPG